MSTSSKRVWMDFESRFAHMHGIHVLLSNTVHLFPIKINFKSARIFRARDKHTVDRIYLRLRIHIFMHQQILKINASLS